MNRFWHAIVIVFGVAVLPSAQAVVISYEAVNIAGNNWRYDYTVENTTDGLLLEEFAITFDLGRYDDLSVANSPEDWDSLVVQPNAELPADGFFDSLALVSGLSYGQSVGGFAVLFTWSGSGMPRAQRWVVLDPITFEELESGWTRSASAPVPEPSTVALLGLGLLGLWPMRRPLSSRRARGASV